MTSKIIHHVAALLPWHCGKASSINCELFNWACASSSDYTRSIHMFEDSVGTQSTLQFPVASALTSNTLNWSGWLTAADQQASSWEKHQIDPSIIKRLSVTHTVWKYVTIWLLMCYDFLISRWKYIFLHTVHEFQFVLEPSPIMPLFETILGRVDLLLCPDLFRTSVDQLSANCYLLLINISDLSESSSDSLKLPIRTLAILESDTDLECVK